MLSNWKSLSLSPAVQSLFLSAKHYIYKTDPSPQKNGQNIASEF